MMDVCVVGCGFMGEHHARAVAEHPTLALDRVVDIDEGRAEDVATRYGATAFETNLERAIAAVDAVIVASPETVHAEQANAVLEAEKHLLLEKPITDDIDTAKALAERASETDLVTGVSFVLRYDPAYAEAQRVARAGELGSIVAARGMRGITTGESRRIGPRGHPNFYMSIHDIDAILAGVDSRVERVAGMERRGELTDLDVPDAMQAVIRFESGATAILEGYGVLPDDVPGGIIASYELVGTDGTVSVETPSDAIEVSGNGFDRPDTRHWPVVNEEMDGAVARQIDRFAKAMSGTTSMEATIEDGYEAQLIAEAIRRSASRDEMIDISSLR